MPQTSRSKQNDHDEEEDSKIFPQKLMEILEDEEHADSICWLPHGRAFIIRNRGLFAEKVMPKFFSRKAKYSSFTRKLNRWNFVRVSSGPELGAYYHEYFRRDKPQLAAQMFCKNARSKLAMANTQSPSASPSDAEQTQTPAGPQPEPSAVPPTKPSAPLPIPAAVPSAQPAPTVALLPPSVLAALMEEGKDSKKAVAPVLGISNMQLLERQLQLMQEEYAQRMLLQQLAKRQLAVQQMQQQQQIQQQQQQQQQQQMPGQPDYQAMMRMRQLMDMRARQRNNLGPNNGRASAA